jgi:hypothetical protein
MPSCVEVHVWLACDTSGCGQFLGVGEAYHCDRVIRLIWGIGLFGQTKQFLLIEVNVQVVDLTSPQYP